ncbi:hypothetical protein FPZ12_029495 [Amycolatopsis acidicola]|uniref:Uncharacterized protein n=1 Tax=Amycolatopsis acidicola TaxID=2596893 RepID=A0A5N0UZI4_9PSEU|nr:hypothetical protein [Amycolatopsis acidicola]KAA9155532.1 hypothetical protein FPZ12_029495 [Amycolatopsis acidicola]
MSARPRFYTSPRPSAPSSASSATESGQDTSLTVSDSGLIRQANPDGSTTSYATTPEAAQEATNELFGKDTKITPL